MRRQFGDQSGCIMPEVSTTEVSISSALSWFPNLIFPGIRCSRRRRHRCFREAITRLIVHMNKHVLASLFYSVAAVHACSSWHPPLSHAHYCDYQTQTTCAHRATSGPHTRSVQTPLRKRPHTTSSQTSWRCSDIPRAELHITLC